MAPLKKSTPIQPQALYSLYKISLMKPTPILPPIFPRPVNPEALSNSNVANSNATASAAPSGHFRLIAPRPADPTDAARQAQLLQLLPQADAQKPARLAQYLKMSVDQLDAALTHLRWVKTDGTYAVKSGDDDLDMPLHFTEVETVSVIDEMLLNSNAEVRELQELMTEYVPRRIQAMLINNAAQVQIDDESFNLPVVAINTHTAQACFPDGSKLDLVKQFRAGRSYYVPVPSAGMPPRPQEAAPSTSQVTASATPSIVWLASEAMPNENSLEVNFGDEVIGLPHAPLFGLEPGEEWKEIKQEPGDDVGMLPMEPGKRHASPGAHESPNKRARLETGAPTRWEAYCATGPARLPVWDALSPANRLRLQAAANSLPSKEEYAARHQGAEQSGTPVQGQEIVQDYRATRFNLMAKRIADVMAGHIVGTLPATATRTKISIQNLRNRIDELLDEDSKQFMTGLLDKAENELSSRGSEPGTLNASASQPIISMLRLLERVEEITANDNETSSAYLKRIFAPFLDPLPEKQALAPNPDISQACLLALETALGIPYKILVVAKPAINALAKVDLRHNIDALQNIGMAPDNPIPKTDKGIGLHKRYNALKLPANQTVFSKFFNARGTICNALKGTFPAADRPDNTIAGPVVAAMLLLEKLESHIDAEGRPAPKEVGTWLKNLFTKVLGQPVDKWEDLGEVGQHKSSIIDALKKDAFITDVRQALQLYSLISDMTGVALWGK